MEWRNIKGISWHFSLGLNFYILQWKHWSALQEILYFKLCQDFLFVRLESVRFKLENYLLLRSLDCPSRNYVNNSAMKFIIVSHPRILTNYNPSPINLFLLRKFEKRMVSTPCSSSNENTHSRFLSALIKVG